MSLALFESERRPCRVRDEIPTFGLDGWVADGAPTAALYRAQGHATFSDTRAEVSFYYNAHPILSYTACGVWIALDPAYMKSDRKKFVNLRAAKQWASGTREEAMRHLLHRRRRHVSILSSQLASAEAVLEALEEMHAK